jgi:hypothetical protein
MIFLHSFELAIIGDKETAFWVSLIVGQQEGKNYVLMGSYWGVIGTDFGIFNFCFLPLFLLFTRICKYLPCWLFVLNSGLNCG